MSNMAPLLASQMQPLRRYARSLTRNLSRTEDLLQDCLARALEKEHLWQPGTDLRAWLFTIMHNQHVNGIRRLVREGAVVPIDEVAGSLHTTPTVDWSMELSEAAAAVKKLPNEQREVIILAIREGTSYEEMARVLGVPIGTVRSRLSRGRARLRQVMGLVDNAPPGRYRPARIPFRRAA